MRRSTRRKSTDVKNEVLASPATTAARRTSRRARKTSEARTEDENENKAEEEQQPVAAETPQERDSSEERPESTRKGRGSRQKTPQRERASPAKQRRTLHRAASPDPKINAIPEEENGAVGTAMELQISEECSKPQQQLAEPQIANEVHQNAEETAKEVNVTTKQIEEKENDVQILLTETIDVNLDEEQHAASQDESSNNEVNTSSLQSEMNAKQANIDDDEDEHEVVKGKQLDVIENIQTVNDADDENMEKTPTRNSAVEQQRQPAVNPAQDEVDTSSEHGQSEQEEGELTPNRKDDDEFKTAADGHKANSIDLSNGRAKSPAPLKRDFKNHLTAAEGAEMNKPGTTTVRKRKWISKRTDSVLSISTDSLKKLISDVHPVPLSDVQLDSSSEVEEISDREEGEKTPSPERERERDREHRRASFDKVDKKTAAHSITVTAHVANAVDDSKTSTAAAHDAEKQNSSHNSKTESKAHRSPTPARHEASCVLYITNLVRPFTVLQLKGLLARTGKIVEEDGFWIDRIKSKCYVQYENEDEAIETRHALHGVRWPVSNPKCLNVDFGRKEDMRRAILSTMEVANKPGQDSNKDNVIISGGWRDRTDDEIKKSARPVREWDVGKKDSLSREKSRTGEKRRSGERDVSGNRENDRERRNRSKNRDARSSSLSPARKLKKKENDPPLRLLDDLFRKTKATPCIYWLPLTPEQIAEKEATLQKRLKAREEREKEREKERDREREKEKSRANERNRNRSSDRRKSRSRDRRRY